MIKVLVVCSINSGSIAPFIKEQVTTIESHDHTIHYFTIRGKGIWGYLKNYPKLRKTIIRYKPDIIHAHYGLSGLLANMQRKIPVVTTYHGSDINNSKAFFFSRISLQLSGFNIFVSDKNKIKAGLNKNCALIPCGVDTEIFQPIDKKQARHKLGLNESEKIVLFAGSFSNSVKNPSLATDAISLLKDDDIRLLELKGYQRNEVALLINAADVCLMTSFSEGSPQFIKEAMACNRPVVCTDVGDVKWVFGDMDGCFITDYNVLNVADVINKAMLFSSKKKSTQGRERIIELGLDLNNSAKKVTAVYDKILSK